MSTKQSRSLLLIVMACLVWFCPSEILATPTGLDNIPTADTVPHRTIVVQEYTDFINDNEPTHGVGFKTGFFDFIELGMDRKVGPGHPGAILYQAKLKFDPARFDWKGNWPRLAAGIANVAWTDRGREISGQPFPYLAASYKAKVKEFDLLQSHIGFGFQNRNEGIFFGFDRHIYKGFTLKTDYITVNNGRDLLSSWGFIYEPGWKFPFNIAIEGWYGVSTQSKRENDFLLKFNYIIQY